ncbi:hypothetical protein KCP70_12565 [Salmonella enterica subsp. enterica]|nr:hypothetical protein KCP70_12565 [Salmonella enterica subsp. enterica]
MANGLTVARLPITALSTASKRAMAKLPGWNVNDSAEWDFSAGNLPIAWCVAG